LRRFEKLEQITFRRKFINLVLLIVVLAVNVAAVYANIIVQQPLVCGVVASLQHASRWTVHILNKVCFYFNIALIASFVTAVANSSSYEIIGLFL